MIWNGSWAVNRLSRDPDVDFDWGVFYLPPMTKATSQYASGRDMIVIGGSAMQFTATNSAFADTGDPRTSKRLQRCIAFLQFMTTPMNTDRVVKEMLCFL